MLMFMHKSNMEYIGEQSIVWDPYALSNVNDDCNCMPENGLDLGPEAPNF